MDYKYMNDYWRLVYDFLNVIFYFNIYKST